LAAKRTPQNGHDRLDEALATLITNQAAFVQQLAENERHHIKFERETAERFARIEGQMAEIIRVLNEHTQLLSELSRMIERLPRANASNSTPIVTGGLIWASVQAYDSSECRPRHGGCHGRTTAPLDQEAFPLTA
jgi:hypothetical protein